MNDNQNKNSNHNNKNKKNLNGLLILVAWAIVLTVLFNYLSVYSKQAASAETTHEIQYSEFKRLVREGQVESVELTEGKIEITTRTSPSLPCRWASMTPLFWTRWRSTA